MQKGLEGFWLIFAFQGEGGANPGTPVTGDSANITAELGKDGGALAATTTTNPTELDEGYYQLPITSTEYDADVLFLVPKSATANVQVIAVPGAIYTRPQDVQQGLIAVGTAQAVTATTLQMAATETFADSELVGATAIITGGSTGVGQSRLVTANVSATDTLTVDTWTVTPTGTITYALIATPPASSGNPVPTNVVEVAGDADSADGLRDTYNGVGYSSPVAPATQEQLGSIGAGSSSGFNFPVVADNTAGPIIDGVTFVGVQTGTFANTEANIATFHQIDDVGNAIDLVYRVAAGATNLFTAVTLDLYLNGGNDELTVQLYDHIGADWEDFELIDGQNGSNTSESTLAPLSKHTGALGTAEAGNLYIRFVTSAQTNPVLFIARCIGTAVAATSTMGYEAGFVYVDEVGGTSSGTVQGIDGVFANQSDDFNNGQTIADNLGTSSIQIHPGNSVTLTSALQGYTIFNVQATLNGGSQDIDATRINGGFLTGTFTRAGTGVPTFSVCNLNNISVDRAAILSCGILGTLTLTEAGLYALVDCQAAGATGVSIVDFNSLGGATVNMERWSGSLTVNNIAAGDSLNLHCTCGGDIVLNGADGTVNISGVVGTVTDNRTGTPAGNDDSVIDTSETISDIDSVTSQFTFTNANEVDANTKSINDAEVVGDGNATPWDGA